MIYGKIFLWLRGVLVIVSRVDISNQQHILHQIIS